MRRQTGKENAEDIVNGCRGCAQTATLIGAASMFISVIFCVPSLRHSIIHLFSHSGQEQAKAPPKPQPVETTAKIYNFQAQIPLNPTP